MTSSLPRKTRHYHHLSGDAKLRGLASINGLFCGGLGQPIDSMVQSPKTPSFPGAAFCLVASVPNEWDPMTERVSGSVVEVSSASRGPALREDQDRAAG